MPDYEKYTKEQLIQRISELENQLQQTNRNQNNDTNLTYLSQFKEKHSREILDILPDMLSIFDYDYNFVALASSENTVHIGETSAHLLGKNLIDILPAEAYGPVKKNFDIVTSTGQASIGYHNLYVDGQYENFENRVIPLDNKHILCICRNITDRVKAQNQLQMITSAINNSLEEIYAVDPEGTIVFANKQFINHYAGEKEISDCRIFDIVPEKDELTWQQYVEAIRKTGGSLNHTECRKIQHKTVFLEVSAYILKNDREKEIVWSIARDITERLAQEKKIHELNKLMDTILNNIPVYLFVKDCGKDFRYLYWNKEFAKMSHIPADFAIGKTDAEIFPDAKNVTKFLNDDQRLLQEKETLDFEEDYITGIGEKRIVHTIKTLVERENQEPLLIGISWDITEQKNTEQELIKARNKAEEADKLKSAFLANMSHEIRTPLNAIVGFAQLMSETDDKADQTQYSDIINKNAELLLQLINDILDLSKIEAGSLEFKDREVCLQTLCQGIFETISPRIPVNVRLVYQPFSETIITLCDSNRLAQVLTNLLNNAQKFTQEGEIRFGFHPQGEFIEFFVQDTGMGISTENIDKIFNRFVKLNTFVQGSGLGLPICQMIVENMGGEIRVESEYGKGTIFRFTIPLRIPVSAQQEPASVYRSSIC